MEGPIPVDQHDLEKLFAAVVEAKEAIIEAKRKLSAVCPHGRNFPLGGFALEDRRYVAAGHKLADVVSYLDELLENLDAYR